MNKIVIYPIYFNEKYSRIEGRRVKKDLAFQPKIEKIKEVAEKLGYKTEIEEKAYPRYWWKEKGRLLINTKDKKTIIIKKIAESY